MRHIDTHVHFRDWDESHKYTIGQGMKLARSQGFVAVCDMPNTKPAITTPELVMKRLRTAEEQGCLDGYYVYIGATGSADQLRSAFRVARQQPGTNTRIAGIKLYAGRSTGDLSVTDEGRQRLVYRIAREERYEGIIAVHCEDEALANYPAWVPENPASWNQAKPPQMEVRAVGSQIRFAREEGFTGNLHICHVSTPAAVELVNDAKGYMRITCAVTPHHLIYSTGDMFCEDDVDLKVNPPIRDIDDVIKLKYYLRAERIDWIETDHAPHTKEDKTYSPEKQRESYMSGIRSMDDFSSFLGWLRSDGFDDEQLERLTYSNIKKIYTMILE